ncbi:hypothetical protein WDU94_004940, partial [Cyamophila willieti]
FASRHNEDGSYTYGYEGGDGSFKIETKLATGEVMGKYGYVDDTGKVRVIEYGANKYGFQPSGEGITVPEPNLVDDTTEAFDKNGRPIITESEEPIVERPRPRQPARAPAARPAPSRQQFASASFQSRESLVQEDRQENTAPVQFVPQSPPRASPSFSAPPPPPPPSFSAPQQPSFSAPQQPSFSAPQQPSFSDDAPPPRLQPARLQPQFNAAPAPPRPVSFAGAAPISSGPPPSFVNAGPAPPRPVAFAGASPAGPSEEFQPQPQFRPRPAQGFFQPAPPSFSQPPRPAPSRQSSSSILDQLAQDFALPQGGSRPLHDITFGAQ